MPAKRRRRAACRTSPKEVRPLGAGEAEADSAAAEEEKKKASSTLPKPVELEQAVGRREGKRRARSGLRHRVEGDGKPKTDASGGPEVEGGKLTDVPRTRKVKRKLPRKKKPVEGEEKFGSDALGQRLQRKKRARRHARCGDVLASANSGPAVDSASNAEEAAAARGVQRTDAPTATERPRRKKRALHNSCGFGAEVPAAGPVQPESQCHVMEGPDSGGAALPAAEVVPHAGDDKVEEKPALACLKICVGNLSWWVDKGMVWTLFEKYGTIENVFMLTDWWTGHSRGVCFVTFKDGAAATAALDLDGTQYEDRKIRVNLAIDKTGPGGTDGVPGKGGGRASSASGKGRGKGKGKPDARSVATMALGNAPEGCAGVFARGLSFEVTEADLTKVFAQCGSGPARVRILADQHTGKSKGKAFIDFANDAAVRAALQLNGAELKGRKLCLEYSKCPAV